MCHSIGGAGRDSRNEVVVRGPINHLRMPREEGLMRAGQLCRRDLKQASSQGQPCTVRILQVATC